MDKEWPLHNKRKCIQTEVQWRCITPRAKVHLIMTTGQS